MKVLSARTPRSSGSPTRRRSAGGGEAAERHRATDPAAAAPARRWLAHGVDDAAEPGSDGRMAGGGRNDRPAAAPHAFQPPRTASHACFAKATTSQGSPARLPFSMVNLEPTDIGVDGPATSTISPRTPTRGRRPRAVDIDDLLASAFMVAQTGADGRLHIRRATRWRQNGKTP